MIEKNSDRFLSSPPGPPFQKQPAGNYKKLDHVKWFSRNRHPSLSNGIQAIYYFGREV